MTVAPAKIQAGGKGMGMLSRDMMVYWLGNAAWLTFSQASATTFPFATIEGQITALGVVQALFFSLAFIAFGVFDVRRGPFGRYFLVKVAVFGCAASLALVLTGLSFAPWVLWIASAVLGFGRAAGFCQWIRILRVFGLHRAKWVLILGSAAHIAMLFLLESVLPAAWRPVCAFGLCAPLGLAALAWSARAYGVEGIEDDRQVDSAGTVRAVRTSAAEAGESGAAEVRGARGVRLFPPEMVLPVICAMALTLITPIASSVFGSEPDSVFGGIITPLSHGACLVVLMVVWFCLKRDITLPQLYCVSLPLFSSIILVTSLIGEGVGWAVLFIGNGCFFLVSVLMVTTCFEIADYRSLRIVSVYGLFAGCMYVTDMVQVWVKYLVAEETLLIEPYVAALLLLYVVTIPVFVIVAPRLRGMKNGLGGNLAVSGVPSGSSGFAGHDAAGREDAGGAWVAAPMSEKPSASVVSANTTVQPMDIGGACALIAQRASLSKRQAEVMEALVGGRDVSHISDALSLSPNTVRSYRKSLYAALGIHSRQELLDLIDEVKEG